MLSHSSLHDSTTSINLLVTISILLVLLQLHLTSYQLNVQHAMQFALPITLHQFSSNAIYTCSATKLCIYSCDYVCFLPYVSPLPFPLSILSFCRSPHSIFCHPNYFLIAYNHLIYEISHFLANQLSPKSFQSSTHLNNHISLAHSFLMPPEPA